MHAQVPRVAEMKEDASKGVGLTGQAWPATPDMIREARAQEQQEKAKSEAVNNVGPSQGAGSQKGSQNGADAGWNSGADQGWGSSGNNAWGKQPTPNAPLASSADGAQGAGGGTGGDPWGNPSGEGIAQKMDFSTWGNNNGQERSESIPFSTFTQKRDD